MGAENYSQTSGTVWQTIPASVALSANMAIMFLNGTAVPFVPIDSNIQFLAGVSSSDVNQGDNCLCVSHGILINDGAFTIGIYYAGANGVLTQTPPTSGPIVQMGYAIDANTLIVAIQQSATPQSCFSITDFGTGTNTYTNPYLISANIILVMKDGIGMIPNRIPPDYTFNSATGTITFANIFKSTQSIIVLYSR